MSRVLLGRATRCVGAAAAALTSLCCAGPALGKSSAPLRTNGAPAPGFLPLSGTVVAGSAPPNATTSPQATASRACPYAGASVRGASTAELRVAVICLVNRFRSRGGLPRLEQRGALDAAAQGHDDQMVAEDYFGHSSPSGSGPGLRISGSGFSWGAYGEAISTGFRTPRSALRAWLRSMDHCQILLSPEYRYIGIGVNARPVRGFANAPGTWTADLALPLGWAAPSRRWALADHCPYR